MIKNWLKARQVLKGLDKDEYRILNILTDLPLTSQEILKEINGSNGSSQSNKNKLKINQVTGLINKLAKKQLVTIEKKYNHLTDEGVRLTNASRLKSKIARQREKLSTLDYCNETGNRIGITTSILKILTGVFTGCLSLISDGIYQIKDYIILTRTEVNLKQHNIKYALNFLLLLTGISGVILLILGLMGIFNPVPIKKDLMSRTFSFLFAIILFSLSRYQLNIGKNFVSFLQIFKSLKSRNHAISSIGVFIISTGSFFGLFVLDGLFSAVIGAMIIRLFFQLLFEIYSSSKGHQTKRQALIRWFQQWVCVSKKKFLTSWLINSIEKNPKSKSEILQLYKSTFYDSDIKLMPHLAVNIGVNYSFRSSPFQKIQKALYTKTYDFQENIDHVLSILMYLQEICIINDKFALSKKKGN